MIRDDRQPRVDAVGEYWNGLVRGASGAPHHDIDPAIVDVILSLHTLDDARFPAPEFLQRLEGEITGGSDAPAWFSPSFSTPRSHDVPNGQSTVAGEDLSIRSGASEALVRTPQRLRNAGAARFLPPGHAGHAWDASPGPGARNPISLPVSAPAPADRANGRQPDATITYESGASSASPGRVFSSTLALALLLLTLTAGALIAGIVRHGGEEPGNASVILPAFPHDPVEFVWQSRGSPDLVATRGDPTQLLPMTGPYHLAIDGQGNLWIPDSWSNQFRVLAPDGAFRQAWGSKGRAGGEFNFLNVGAVNWAGSGAAAFDAAGNLYVADPGNFRIQKFAPDLSFVTAWGSKGEGAGQFLALKDLAIDAQGRIYALDSLRADIQVFDADGEFVTRWGGKGVGEGEFLSPYGIAIDAEGNVVVADTGNHRIQKFSSRGTFMAMWGGMGTDVAMFRHPDDVAVDAKGRLFVTDSSNNRVQILDADGTFLAQWGEQGSEPGQLSGPAGIALDRAGNVYVTESINARVQKFRLLPPFWP